MLNILYLLVALSSASIHLLTYSRGLGTGDWVKSLCLEKFRSAQAPAGTPVALGRKRDCSHWLDFSLCV
ncbi:hypothetical protein JYQ62_10900 [Nostoc sp. UHCC 0702]|nr:hypothetical protein JYQ62_10900 [Nostoc sp. UHCC 0702]